MMFTRSQESQTEPTSTPPKPAAAAPVKSTAAPSIIATDVRIIGNLITNGEIQLDGEVEGDVRAASLTLGESGNVTGTVTAETVIVKGTVNGQIRAQSIRVEKTARVKGDLCHEIVSVEAGAIVDGQFRHTVNPLETKTGGEKPVKVVAEATTEQATTGPRAVSSGTGSSASSSGSTPAAGTNGASGSSRPRTGSATA